MPIEQDSMCEVFFYKKLMALICNYYGVTAHHSRYHAFISLKSLLWFRVK